MFDKPYSFQKLGSSETLHSDPIRRLNYRFKAKYRTYFVTLGIFSFGVTAIKYCDVKDKGSHHAYKKIFNDGDAFRVITTCLFIMLEYWKQNPDVSFAFYAVPRELKEMLMLQKKMSVNEAEIFIDRYKHVRFTIYKYAMVNLFPDKIFLQIRDTKNSIYLLLNKKQKKQKTTVKRFGKFLLDNYELIFEPDGNG